MGPQLDALWQEYLVSDTQIRQTIERTLRVTLAQRLAETFESEHVLLKPPPQDLAGGDYPVGLIHYGKDSFYPFGLREDEFIQHIGIFGRSGSGKTNLAYLLLRGLVQAGKPFLVFDWKRNYRDLIRVPEFADLLIFTVGRDVAPFRFNPLVPPPGTPATVWLKKLIEIMCHAYFLGEGVTVLLMRAIDHLYWQAGLYNGNPKGYPAIAMIQDCLHLDSEQAGYLNRLEVGWAVAKLQGRWFFPFLIKLPLIRLNKGSVTDKDIHDRAKKLAGDGRELLSPHRSFSAAIPSDGGDSAPKGSEKRKIPRVPVGGKKEDRGGNGECTIELTTQEREFLMDVWQHPASSVTERYRRLSFSSRRGSVLQSSLVSRSFLSFHPVSLLRGRIKSLRLTKQGRKALGMSNGESDRYGGAEHQYWVHRVAEHLGNVGYAVRTEHPVGGGKTIDIAAERGGKRIAFEIETGKSDAAANVRKCLDAGMDKVVVVATSKAVQNRIAPTLPNGEQVVCVTASQALNGQDDSLLAEARR